MGSEVEAVRAGDGTVARLPTGGNDPIAAFAGEINRMLDELERYR